MLQIGNKYYISGEGLYLDWLLFVHTLPGQNGALRVSVWRTLQALGAGSVRDGVAVLPERPEFSDAFTAIRKTIVASGGTAYVLRVPGADGAADTEFRALFDRSQDYATFIAGVELQSGLRGFPEFDARRQLRQQSRELLRIESIDFFGSDGRERAQTLLSALSDEITKQFSPGEPVPVSVPIPQLSAADYTNRLWVTRRHMWVDRVACAWVIARFIDRGATFDWIDDGGATPAHAIGFDYDSAQFTHVDDLTTFEVLIASFGLSGDAALTRIAAMVHALDIGGPAVAESAGFEVILAGARDRTRDDRELLIKMTDVLDSFYEAMGNDVS